MNTNLLRDHSETALKFAAETNMIEFMKTAPLPEDNVYEGDDMWRWYSGFNHPIRNWVLNPRFTEENAEEKIRGVIRFFKSKKTPFFCWIGPSATPSNLGEILEAHGMVKINPLPNSGDMRMDLRNLEVMEKKYQEIIDKTGIKVEYVRTQDQLQEAGILLAKVAGFPKELIDIALKSCGPIFAQDPSVNNNVVYVAYLDGKIVSMSQVYYKAGIIGTWNLLTMPKYQRRGIGTVITLAPMIDARKRSYEIAYLNASEQGLPMYQRIGYKRCEVGAQYVWFPQGIKRLLARRYVRKKERKSQPDIRNL
jgi:GNAT superfamily N-acetyltransferase